MNFLNVIIPVFNRPIFVERAINSVLNQTFQDFILTIVDDGSTDDTPRVLDKFQGHPKVKIIRQENMGVSCARNMAFKSTSSTWICFLDSDDEWLPQKLEKQIAYLMLHPEHRLVHSEEFWIRNGVRVNQKTRHSKSDHHIFERSLELCLISPSTVILSSELFFKHGMFNESFVVCEDYDLWLKILSTEEIGFLPEFLVNKYGGHEDQLSTKYPAMDYWRIKSLMQLLSQPLDISHLQMIKDHGRRKHSAPLTRIFIPDTAARTLDEFFGDTATISDLTNLRIYFIETFL